MATSMVFIPCFPMTIGAWKKMRILKIWQAFLNCFMEMKLHIPMGLVITSLLTVCCIQWLAMPLRKKTANCLNPIRSNPNKLEFRQKIF